MKAVLISIHPKWVDKILDGKKTIEVRKTRPKIETPFKCYIYMTAGGYEWQKEPFSTAVVPPSGEMYNGAKTVVAEFTCDKIIATCGWRLTGDTGRCAPRTADEATLPELSRLTLDELLAYAGSANRILYGWHISGLKVYDKPKKLEDFTPHCEFMTDDMLSCDHNKVACYYQHFDHNPWPDCSLNTVTCRKRMKRPPQSWCYVENTIHD